MLKKFILASEKDSINLAKQIAINIKPNDILAFSGDLGSGKTFFCREIIKSLCGSNTMVISPTFNLLQTYSAPNFEIYHFDLYRLKHISEVYELGIEEAFNNHVCLIEWPEIISAILPRDTISITLKIINSKKRQALIKQVEILSKT